VEIGNVAALALTAITSGLIIALLEETLFRGAMFTAIQKQSSVLFAVLATSLVYAFIHFLQPNIEFDSSNLNWASGFILLKNAFLHFTKLEHIIDSFIALFLAGVLLAIVRARSNRIALCMGIHAGWVIAIKIFKRVTDTNIYSEFSFLTGSYDKVIGYLAAICIAIFIVIYVKITRQNHLVSE
jgi:membrane protease YdiL (CAAX protease family)